MSDRKLGYAIICLFLAILFVIGGYCLRPVLSPQQTRVIAFEKVGNLRIDDQVRLKGIAYGIVKKIDWTREKVFVTVQSRSPWALHAGYSVTTLDAGIMGDRMVMINDGPSAGPVVAANDTLSGSFVLGVSEALGYALRLRGVVDSLRDMADLLLLGDKQHPSFVAQTNGVIRTADSLSKSLVRFASTAESAVSSGLDSIDNIVKTASQLSQSAAVSAPEFLSMLDKQVTKTAALVASIDSAADRLLGTSAGLSRKDNVLWRNDLEHLTGNLVVVQKAIADIQLELLQFKTFLRLW
jgi:ABC-type transporter Mla subunit MlaD